MNEQDYKVIEMMEKYGGSFVQALAECFHRADSHNTARLKYSFPDYWSEYEEMAKNNV